MKTPRPQRRATPARTKSSVRTKRIARIEVLRVDTWSELHALFDGPRFRDWAFRGQEDESWPIESSLARALARKGIPRTAWRTREERIIRIFRRKAHLLLPRTPSDFFEWLALMQHHGAPTRLLDFTWSPYVASFFALDRATKDAAIWAILPSALQSGELANRLFDRSAVHEDLPIGIHPWNSDRLAEYVLSNRDRWVVVGEPYHLNRRLIAQSGTFVLPCDNGEPVESLIASMPGGLDAIKKIVLSTKNLRETAVRKLYTMNLTHATLFPDLDGLARSMDWELEMDWHPDPRTGRPRRT